MVIRHSIQLLEQLSEVEDQIRRLELLMRELRVEYDQEILIEGLLNRRRLSPPGEERN